MIQQKTSTIGLVELPTLGLFNVKGKNMLFAETKGLPLVSKQILLSNLQAAGFDAQLVNLRQGDYQEEYGKIIWRNTEYSKVYFGSKIQEVDPLAYEAWGVTNNFSQHREIAYLTIQHLASKGQPVIVGGSDAIAEPIRTQSPLLAHINDQPEIWAEMWKTQTELGCIPYYMFITRDTKAQHYFGVPLIRAWDIFKNAYQSVTGLARTVRGPSMSTTLGKVQMLGVSQIKNEKIFVMQFLQARNPGWVMQPFFAKYNEKATWFDELEPFGEQHFFFEKEMR